jgi:hypothetical protein
MEELAGDVEFELTGPGKFVAVVPSSAKTASLLPYLAYARFRWAIRLCRFRLKNENRLVDLQDRVCRAY